MSGIETKSMGKLAAVIEGKIEGESSKQSVAMRLWRWLAGRWRGMQRNRRRQPKQLRLCESLPLGERRFVAVVEFERSRFLIGGTQGSLVLLAPLQGAEETTAGENGNRNQNKQDLKIWQRSRDGGTKTSASPGGRP